MNGPDDVHVERESGRIRLLLLRLLSTGDVADELSDRVRRGHPRFVQARFADLVVELGRRW